MAAPRAPSEFVVVPRSSFLFISSSSVSKRGKISGTLLTGECDRQGDADMVVVASCSSRTTEALNSEMTRAALIEELLSLGRVGGGGGLEGSKGGGHTKKKLKKN